MKLSKIDFSLGSSARRRCSAKSAAASRSMPAMSVKYCTTAISSSRDIERGTRSLSSLLNYLAFSILPVLAEFALVATILLSGYDPWYTLITFGAVAVYIVSTFAITRWRMPFRARMNALDSQANARAVDGLINAVI